MPSTPPLVVRCLIKLELNLDHMGNVFFNPTVTIEDMDEESQRSDRLLYAVPSMAKDQAYNRIQERLNTMLQLALNEMHRAGKTRFNT